MEFYFQIKIYLLKILTQCYHHICNGKFVYQSFRTKEFRYSNPNMKESFNFSQKTK